MIRKVLLHPFTLAFAFAGVATAAFGLAALSVLSFVLALASVAFLSIRQAREMQGESALEDLSNQERAELAPLRRLRNEISQTVQERNQEISIAVVGAEAIQEADRILEQCTKLVRLRKELKRGLFSGRAASQELASLETDLKQAASEAEKVALGAALEARKLEQEHYREADSALVRIEAGLRQAEAALSEMKARLTAVSATAADADSTEELRETIGRMKALGSSLNEADEWLRGSS